MYSVHTCTYTYKENSQQLTNTLLDQEAQARKRMALQGSAMAVFRVRAGGVTEIRHLSHGLRKVKEARMSGGWTWWLVLLILAGKRWRQTCHVWC